MSVRSGDVIRLFAGLDLIITGLIAFPFTAPIFVATLYALDRALGGAHVTPPLTPLGWFFTNLAGFIGVLWALVRLFRPEPWLARADAVGRCAVAALLAWYLMTAQVPGLMWAFVVTEALGAAAQGLVTRGRA